MPDGEESMRVSVLTPTYNRAETLPRAVRSVREQTYEPIEHIVVDDGSTDDTEAAMAGFAGDGLTYVRCETNRGVSTARNVGIDHATGEAIVFVDDDDALPPSAVAVLVDALQSAPRRCGGVFGHHRKHRPDGTIEVAPREPGIVTYEDLCTKNCMGAFGGKLLLAEVFDTVGRIDESFPSSEDFDFFMRASAAGYTFTGIDAITYDKYRSPEQLSDDTTAWIDGQRRILEKYGTTLSSGHRARRWFWMGRTHANLDRMEEARRCFRRAVTLDPRRAKYAISYLAARFGVFDYALAAHRRMSRS